MSRARDCSEATRTRANGQVYAGGFSLKACVSHGMLDEGRGGRWHEENRAKVISDDAVNQQGVQHCVYAAQQSGVRMTAARSSRQPTSSVL